MKGIVFAVLVVVVSFVGVGAETIMPIAAYNNATNQSLSVEEWCGCMTRPNLTEQGRRPTWNACDEEFKVFERYPSHVGALMDFNCTGILTNSATTTESSTTSDPSTSPSTESVVAQNESTTNPATTTGNKGVISESPANSSTIAASNDNDTITSNGTTDRVSGVPVTESTEKANPETKATEKVNPGTNATEKVNPGTKATEKGNPETEVDGSNHLYWTLPLICVLLLAMLIGGFLIFRYTKKAGYLQQPAKSTVNGDSTKKTTEGGV